MKGDFLVELGTEELPPKALLTLSNAFTSGVADGFKAANLHFEEVRSYAAPRRLAIIIKALDTQTPDAEVVATTSASGVCVSSAFMMIARRLGAA